jgi:chromosome segregation ATPase
MPGRIEDNNKLWYQKSDPNEITGQDLYVYYQTIVKDSNGKEDYAKEVVLSHLNLHLLRNGEYKLFKTKKEKFEKELEKNQPNLMTSISSESLNSVDSAMSTDSTNPLFEINELQSYYEEFGSIGNDVDKLKEFKNKVQDKIRNLNTQIKIHKLSIEETQKKKTKTSFFNQTKKQKHETTIEELEETINNVNNKITQYEMLLSQIEDKMSPLFELVPTRENYFNQRENVVEDHTELLKPYFQKLEEYYVTASKHLQLNVQQSNSSFVHGFVEELDKLKLTMSNTYQNEQYKRVTLVVDCSEVVEVLQNYIDIFVLYIYLLESNNTIPEDVKRMLLTHCQDFIELIESERQLFRDDDCEKPKWLGFNMFDIIVGEIVVPYLEPYRKTPKEIRELSLELQEKETLLARMKTNKDLNFNALKSANDLDKLNVYVSSPTSLNNSKQQLNRRLEKSKSIQSITKKLNKSSSMFNIFSPKPSDDEIKQEELEREIKILTDEIKFQEKLRELIQKFESQQNSKSFLSQGGGTKRRRRKRTRKNKRTHKKKFIRKSKKNTKINYI